MHFNDDYLRIICVSAAYTPQKNCHDRKTKKWMSSTWDNDLI